MLNHIVVLFLITVLFSLVTVPISIPSRVYKNSLFSAHLPEHLLSLSLSLFFFYNSYLNRNEVISPCGFAFHFRDD